MAQRAFGALVVCDPANLFYLTGYNAWSFYTPQCLLVAAEGPPHLFARAQDAAGAAYTCNLPDDHIHGYPEELVHRPDVHPFDWIAASIRTLVPDGELVGVECDAHFFSPRAYFALERGPAGEPAGRLGRAGELGPGGQVAVRSAAAAHRRHHRRTRDADRPRQRCGRVGGSATSSPRSWPRRPPEHRSTAATTPPSCRCCRPVDAAGAPHLTWTDRPFEKGAATTIELAGAFGRYHAPLARTVMLGEPPQRSSPRPRR